MIKIPDCLEIFVTSVLINYAEFHLGRIIPLRGVDYESVSHILKGLAQAKIIKKSVILFRVLNMTI